MSYIGTEPAAAYTTPTKQTITGTGVATYTLDYDVASEHDIQVFLNNVRQEGGTGKAYTVSDNQITFASNIASTDDLYVIFSHKAVQTLVHPAGQDLQAREGTFSGNVDINGNELILDADGDTSITADTDDQIDFKTGGSDRATIDANGNVGVGTSSPNNLLEVRGTSDGQNVLHLSNTAGTSDGGASNLVRVTCNGNSNWANLNLQAYTTIFTQNGTEAMRLDSSGRLLMGATSAIYSDAVLQIKQNNTASGNNGCIALQNQNASGGSGVRTVICLNSSGTFIGGISNTSSSTSFNTSSDYRLKENDVDMTGAIARVKQLQPKRFNFIADPDDTTVDGFMAHEVQTVVPEAITGTHNEVDDDGNAVYQGIDQSKLVPLLTGALQEAIAKIEALETRVQALENA